MDVYFSLGPGGEFLVSHLQGGGGPVLTWQVGVLTAGRSVSIVSNPKHCWQLVGKVALDILGSGGMKSRSV
jgi:hypothetical protein